MDGIKEADSGWKAPPTPPVQKKDRDVSKKVLVSLILLLAFTNTLSMGGIYYFAQQQFGLELECNKHWVGTIERVCPIRDEHFDGTNPGFDVMNWTNPKTQDP